MNAETIKAIADLVWPILAAVVLFGLLPTLRKVIQSRNVTIKYGQMELSVQDAADQLRRQVEDLQDQVRALQEGRKPAPPQLAEAKAPPPTPGRTILWVDDKPLNNAHEIAKLQRDGWEIITVTSTGEALQFLSSRSAPPTVIVSDMARREGLTYKQSAGLDLVREVRARKINTPIYIYTASSVDAYRPSVEQSGGNGITASPIELFRLVTSSSG